jgi:hypothetical protein
VNLLRTALVLLALATPVGFAQRLYLGAVAGTPLSTQTETLTDSFELGAQLGVNVSPSFGVRAAVEGNLPRGEVRLGSLAALFRFYLPLSANAIYVGGGADAFLDGVPGSLAELSAAPLGAHAVAGAEFRFGRFGLFAEALPGYVLGGDPSSPSAYYVRARGGVNLHF